jgi:hypothetical protein
MASRHSRDVRMHDPPQQHHMTPSATISPAVGHSVPSHNPNIINKLNLANEQTWLLIGGQIS